MTKPNLGGLGPATGSAWGAFLRAHAELIAVMNEELEAAELLLRRRGHPANVVRVQTIC